MRKLIKTLLFLLLSLPLLVLLTWLYLLAQLKQLGITDWSLDFGQLSWHQATLSRLAFTQWQPDYQLDISATDVHLSWSWPAFFRPQLHTIHLTAVAVKVQTVTGAITKPAPTPTDIVITPDWTLPAWLPQSAKIDQLTITLPCAAASCQYLASVSLQQLDNLAKQADQSEWQLSWQLTSPEHNLTLHSEWLYQHQAAQKSVQATMQLNQHFALSLKQQLNQQRQASTQFALAVSPPSADFLALLASWQLFLPVDWLNQFKQPVQMFVTANWQLPESFQQYEHAIADAHFQLFARAPDPFIVPGIGRVKGEIQAEFTLAEQRLQQWQLVSDLELSHYAPAALSKLFATPLAPLHVNLQSRGADSPFAEGLLVAFKAKTAAPLQSELQSQIHFTWQNGLDVQVQQATLNMQSPKITADTQALTLENLTIELDISGHWQAQGWQLAFSNQSKLSGDIKHPIANSQLHLTLADTTLSQQLDSDIALHSKLQLNLNGLQQTQLLNQNWQFHSELTGSLQQLNANGRLTNDSGLALQHQLQLKPGHNLNVNWQLDDIFLLAGNPLKTTFIAWPELFDLNRGRIAANGQMLLDLASADLAITAPSQLQFRDLAGLYDRTLFSGLSSQLVLELSTENSEPSQLHLHIPNLQLQQLNHGIDMGPLQLHADYRSALSSPLEGVIKITEASMQFLKGELRLTPTELDLNSTTQHLDIQITQLDLSELLRQHPTTDLYAQGKISGRIPLFINNKQVSVQQGSLVAEEPGGQIQYRSTASAAGSANTGMKLVFDALDDFHFKVLTSEVSYSTAGKLELILNIQGSNPAVQQGRAINLTINLEEDLPAMITSLQLTNKLNDTLTKRVQQYIQRQQAAKSAVGESK